MKRTDKKKENVKIIEKNKEIKYIIMWLLILAAVFIISYFIFRNYGRIEYEGMYFVKEKIGTAVLYHYNYYIKDDINNKIYSYNLYLRNDPRYNNVNAGSDKFSFALKKPFYIGINSSGLSNCSLSLVAMDTLIQFLTYNNNLIKVNVGTVDKNESKIKNMTYVSCGAYWDNTVILVREGSETKVVREGNCYLIQIANCEITQATEKFILKALIDAKKTKSANPDSS